MTAFRIFLRCRIAKVNKPKVGHNFVKMRHILETALLISRKVFGGGWFSSPARNYFMITDITGVPACSDFQIKKPPPSFSPVVAALAMFPVLSN